MIQAVDLFNQLCADNNLGIQLSKSTVRYIENGGLIVDPPKLQVYYIKPPVEQTPEPEKSLDESNISEPGVKNETVPEANSTV